MLLFPAKYMKGSTSHWFNARYEKGKFRTKTIQNRLSKRSAPGLNEILSKHSPSSIEEASKAEESTNDLK